MKSNIVASRRPIHVYTAGDLLLEFERLTTGEPVFLPVLGGPKTKVPPGPAEPEDLIKIKPDDFPALHAALTHFKLDLDTVNKYHQLLGTAITMVSSVVWVVGAISTVASAIEWINGGKKEQVPQWAAQLSAQVAAIFDYLGNKEIRGLHNEAVAARADLGSARNAITNAVNSRSPDNLDALKDHAKTLDPLLVRMLSPQWGVIAFQRKAYGYAPNMGHWIDGCKFPFMRLVDGTPVNFQGPGADLGSSIWDPGHYLDVLANGLVDRIALLATTEPAFRSTWYDMDALKNLETGLTDFIIKWRASLIIADPLVGLNGNGPLLNPFESHPIPGLVLGAIDPVTGIAMYLPLWQDFSYKEVWKGSLEAKGWPDEIWASDPTKARADALTLFGRMIEEVTRASGIGKFAELRARLQDIRTRSTVGSDFVELPNANFNLVSMTGPAAQVEEVDLDSIGKYSKNPGKKYPGKRYTQTFEKRFRFAMALRTDVSLIQLGYRMTIGAHNTILIPFSVAHGSGTAPRFPTQPISFEIRDNNALVYDVYQNAVFRAVDEDRFEGAITPTNPMVSLYEDLFNNTSQPMVSLYKDVLTGPPERLFLNERTGKIAVKVDISFEADLNSPAQPFVGFATVKILNLEPEQYQDGFILPVAVYETRYSGRAQTEEVLADSMTIHFAPSFLVLRQEYFDDRRDGNAGINSIYGGVNDRFAISVNPLIIGPEWQVRRRAEEEVLKIRALEEFARAEPELAEETMRRYQLPQLRQ
jgi:hypothetical protein